MAKNQQVVSVNGWTQLTNADVTAITFQVLTTPVFIRFTTDETEPSASDEGILYQAGEGELNKSISDLTNLASADRVWARNATPDVARVYVDHA